MSHPPRPAPSPRTPTKIDHIAEGHLEAQIELSPILGTYLGIPGGEDRLDDFSIHALRTRRDLAEHTAAALDAEEPADPIDVVTAQALGEELTITSLLAERVIAGVDPTALNVLDCPVQSVRDVFDLMGASTPQHWEWILGRLRAVPTALQQYADALRYSAARGAVPSARQVRSVASQCHDQARASTSTYSALLHPSSTAPEAMRDDLNQAANDANAAFGVLAQVLTAELLDLAPTADAAGIERYQLLSRAFLGTQVDLAETYRWGQQELARITELMEQTADQIRPGASVKEAIAILDANPSYQLSSPQALREWMQTAADEAVVAMADTHFEIPEPIRAIEARIAPSQTGIIYYTGPSEDLSRPGRMWWSVPAGTTSFTTWRELTTVYHEGVPGHHLQIAQTTLRRDTLNRWRRLACWNSGLGEGWALYAEWLMSDLGYLDDPGMRMGLLDAQSLRAARVVIDIGVHCEFDAPREVGGGAWTYDKAWTFLNEHVSMEEGFARFELDRYLGYPGQAPSYKVGERLWLDLREEVQSREGDAFDLAALHRRALDLGGVGLDVLRSAVLEQA